MTILQIDGSLDSVFCALFIAFTNKLSHAKLSCGNHQLSLTDTTIRVTTDRAQAERISRALVRYGGNRLLFECETAMRSGDENKYEVIFRYLHRVLLQRSSLKNMLALAEVIDFERLLKRIWCEVHRFHGFIRFSRSVCGTYYAPFSPDHDVTELLLPHFSSRYPSMPFAIHDVKRGKIGVWNGKDYAVFDCDMTPSFFLSEDEQALADLWKTYYDAVTVRERPHEKQMLGYMPRRYWKYLTEKSR